MGCGSLLCAVTLEEVGLIGSLWSLHVLAVFGLVFCGDPLVDRQSKQI